ncbi:MAG: dihydroneopterin aldolase [Armatimonadota bacterium]
MDRILIKDLTARCILGVSAEERREKQDVVINIALVADLRRPGRSDRFEDAIDYRALKKEVLAAVEASSYRLVEALAERIAEICLEPPGVQQVTVTVEKPSALRFARTVGVEITRHAQDGGRAG